jgi:hypothetical protein
MPYILVTSKGVELKFHTAAAAELFRNMYGGHVVHADLRQPMVELK